MSTTYLSSKIEENELNIDEYPFQQCDHPDDTHRGGIGIYCKSTLPCTKPELTKLEALVFQVKFGTKKYFFTCLYRDPSTENNSMKKLTNLLTN